MKPWIRLAACVLVGGLLLAWDGGADEGPPPAWARWVIDDGTAPVLYSSAKPRLLRGGWVVFRPGPDRGRSRVHVRDDRRVFIHAIDAP